MSFSEFTRKYMIKTNFLRYFGLCNAITASRRETLVCGVDNCEMNHRQTTLCLCGVITVWNLRG